jgi:hypothetical protein
MAEDTFDILILIGRPASGKYVVFPNEDDVTTGKPEQLNARLESVLGKLWSLYQQR